MNRTILHIVVSALLGALGLLGGPALSDEQALIHACVDNAKGTLRIVVPGSACTTKEHALSWPAEPGTGTVTYYYRDRIFTVTPGFPVGQVMFCDDPADTAVSGGYSWDGSGVDLTDSAILVNWSCRASGGTCSGSAGQDGWYVVAYLGQEGAALSALAQALTDPDATVKTYALYALTQRGGNEAVSALGQALRDPDTSIRQMVIESIASKEEGHALLLEALSHDDETIRSLAAFWLEAAPADGQ